MSVEALLDPYFPMPSGLSKLTSKSSGYTRQSCSMMKNLVSGARHGPAQYGKTKSIQALPATSLPPQWHLPLVLRRFQLRLLSITNQWTVLQQCRRTVRVQFHFLCRFVCEGQRLHHVPTDAHRVLFRLEIRSLHCLFAHRKAPQFLPALTYSHADKIWRIRQRCKWMRCQFQGCFVQLCIVRQQSEVRAPVLRFQTCGRPLLPACPAPHS